MSAAIARRAHELVKQRLSQLDNASPSNGHLLADQPKAEATSVLPLPEAPVSITLKATLHGHEVMVTLRGVDFASVKAQVEQASQWLKVQAPAQPPTQSPVQTDQSNKLGWCAKHGVQMRQNHKEGRSWWSHWTPEGWCKGK